MYKVDQHCRWSTKDFINYLYLIHLIFLLKKKLLNLACLLHLKLHQSILKIVL